MAAYQTRELVAGRYVSLKTCLSHTVEVNEHGIELRVLCGKVKLDSVADEYASDTEAAPTCPHCLKKDPRHSGT